VTHRLTIAEVRRRKCFRCKTRPGYAVWSICADGNRPRAICRACDITLNRLVLRWAGVANWQQRITAYARKVKNAT